jgi:hypothetical protein
MMSLSMAREAMSPGERDLAALRIRVTTKKTTTTKRRRARYFHDIPHCSR